jgi:amidohydrolase
VTGDPRLSRWLDRNGPELVDVRRHLHAAPELGREEHATTDFLAERLDRAGLAPQLLPTGSGLWVDVGTPATSGRTVMVRADIDALPLQDEKDVPYRSQTPGVCHACGHDVHTSVALGVALLLSELDPPGCVRVLFQPAEEQMPGGALDVIDAGVLEPVSCALALHCDPTLDVGKVGVRAGAITAAADRVELTVHGPGGHTSRPQNTVDLVYVLGRLVTEIPAALGRLVDPRSSLSLVWGQVTAGTTPNAIPSIGRARGTLRMLDRDAWHAAPALVQRVAEQLAAPYGATVEVGYTRGVPPVVNSAGGAALLAAAANRELGADAAVPTLQSLGGEDFAWYLEHVPGAMARLGTRTPGGPTYDLHQAAFDVDERAIAVGVRVLASAALAALSD